MSLFRWENIDHSLVILKLTDLAEKMHGLIKADENRIRFENRGNLNSNTVPSLVLKMKQDRADEWARKAYEIYCDVWQKQGYAKSPAFLRAVFGRGIVPLLRARTGAIASEFGRFSTRKSFPRTLSEAHLQSLHLNMLRLESRWRRQIEIEAKECEHGERRQKLASTRISQAVTPPVETVQDASFTEKGSTREKPSLGPKKQDLSHYLDSAKLTLRQHECMSLHFEYELKLTEIARRLGIDRKTVEEHVALGRAKLERQTARGRHQKNLAKVKPGGLDM